MEATTQGEPIRWRADELLAQAGWLGHLAHRLVDDPSAADDVVQDTWIAALRRPPERERELRPWLAQVARNVARMQRRGESRRREREGSRAEEHVAPSPDELAARLEGQRMLVAALGELDEPYRSTILLAYFEHLTSEQIAARSSVAAGTVRWRIKVGLDQLRARLDRRHDGERSAWSLALLPLVRSESSTAAASVTALSLQGAFLMQTLLKAGAAAAAVVIVAGVLVYSGAVPQFSLRAREEAPLAVTFRPIETPSEVSVDPAAAGERVATPAQPGEANAVALVSEPTATSALVDARFLDESGNALSGVSFSMPAHLGPKPDAATSGVDGRARLRLELPYDEWPVSVMARAAGFAAWSHTAQSKRGEIVHLGDVVLAPGGNIAGRAVDQHGEALEGVVIGLDSSYSPRSESAERRRLPFNPSYAMRATTGADGAFTIEGVPVGFARLAAGGTGWLTTFSPPIEVVAGRESAGVELVLEPVPSDELISGTVLDPTGSAAAYARVSYRYHSLRGSGNGSLNTDEHGKFQLVVTRRVPHDVDAFDGAGEFGGAHAGDVEPGTRDLVLRLRQQSKVEIVVRSTDGHAIEDFFALAYDPDGAPAGANSGAGLHTQGRVELAPQTARFAVRIDAPGYELGEQGPFEGSVPTELEFVLAPLPGVSGRVLHEGAPVAAAQVEAFRCGTGKHEVDGFRVRCEPGSRADAASNANGEFSLTLREAGRYLLRASAPGYAASEIGPLDIDPRMGVQGLTAQLTPGGRIEVRVLAAAGRETAGTLVAFSRGDGFAFTRRAGEGGTLVAEHLVPGRWEVRLAEFEIAGRNSTRSWPRGEWDVIPTNCEVVEGRTTRFDLDLRSDAHAAVELRGRLTIDGAVPGEWTANWIGNDLHAVVDSSAARQLDREGRFVLTSADTTSRRLLLVALGGAFDGLRVLAPVQLVEGANEWSLDLRSARAAVENVVIADPRTDQLGLVWVGEKGTFALRPILAEGSSEVAMPAGLIKLWRLDENVLDSDPRSWRALAEGTVAAGERITLRAP